MINRTRHADIDAHAKISECPRTPDDTVGMSGVDITQFCMHKLLQGRYDASHFYMKEQEGRWTQDKNTFFVVVNTTLSQKKKLRKEDKRPGQVSGENETMDCLG